MFVGVLARVTAGRAPATATGAAVRWALVLSTAYALAAPYSLPWYDLLTWATLPAHGGERAGPGAPRPRSRVLALAYVPGRVVGDDARGRGRSPWRAPQRRRRMPCCWLWGVLTVVWRRAVAPD